MLRKLSVLLVIALLALTAACNSKSSDAASAPASSGSGTSATGSAAAGATPSVAATDANGCPLTETKKFAKTEFVADAALAGGAFKRYIYKPAKLGKFKHGAKGKVVALIKAAAAGAFVINRLNAAKVNVESDPALCKVLIGPLKSFSNAVTALIGKTKNGLGTISPSDVDSGNSQLTDLHSAATTGGTAFTDNQNTSA